MDKSDSLGCEQDTILIVDDLKANLKLLTYILEAKGYQTSFALSGREALERLTILTPDLILLDLMMPDLNGLEVCQRVKSNPDYGDIPIIFLTASQEEHHLIEAFELGADDYVTKPFRKPELLRRVKTQITIRKQHKEILDLQQRLKQAQLVSCC
ncbi:response regulator receiver protein [Cyanobacterium stanieri PCC 7202]|uniref:Response regulator receiver protein n=1 Tax=Cyanobacterium stanieri (strain ATCC 29140 / PCC 7202) TaxID=292563 RepID=K9YMG1_CYASC|nr:response regulator receiver protein [Cyanobacterium stanieri PCC 7202]